MECCLCGYSNPVALMRVGRSLLERHHIYGEKTDSTTVVVCRNCHAELSEAQLEFGAPLSQPVSRVDVCLSTLRGHATYDAIRLRRTLQLADEIEALRPQLEAAMMSPQRDTSDHSTAEPSHHSRPRLRRTRGPQRRAEVALEAPPSAK